MNIVFIKVFDIRKGGFCEKNQAITMLKFMRFFFG